MNNLFIKANRIFTPLRKYAFFYTLFVAFVGLWYPIVGVSVLLVILGLLTVSFFKGRFWCGNFCAHGSLFDSALVRYSRNIRIPKIFRSKIIALAFFVFFSYNIGSGLVRVAGLWGEPIFWERLGYIFVRSYLMVTIAGGLFAILHAPRTWCNICPMGMMQKGSYQLGKWLNVAPKTDKKITITDPDMCHACGKCYRVCPMQLKPYLGWSEENQFDDINCIRCNTCVEHCPAGILSLSSAKEAFDIKLNVDKTGYESRIKMASTVTEINRLKDDVIEIRFSLNDLYALNYQAGQFILVKIQEDPIMYRAFSISSFDLPSNTLTVTVKYAPNGYGSNVLFNQFNVGDEVTLEGPMGHELIVDKTSDHVVLVAGGIGITPFVPIVEDLLTSNNEVKKVTLVYGVNKEEEFLYSDVFETFEANYKQFNFVKVVANEPDFEGEKGFVTDVLKKLELEDSKVYMCGPKPMTNATVNMLKNGNFPEENISYESA